MRTSVSEEVGGVKPKQRESAQKPAGPKVGLVLVWDVGTGVDEVVFFLVSVSDGVADGLKMRNPEGFGLATRLVGEP